MEVIPHSIVEDQLVLPPERKISLGEIYDQLKASLGNVSDAARELGVSRSNLKTRIDACPALVSLLSDLREGIIDKGESNIFAGVMRGDATDSRFVVSTIGKERGWSAGVAGTGKNGEIVVQINQLAPETSSGS